VALEPATSESLVRDLKGLKRLKVSTYIPQLTWNVTRSSLQLQLTCNIYTSQFVLSLSVHEGVQCGVFLL